MSRWRDRVADTLVALAMWMASKFYGTTEDEMDEINEMLDVLEAEADEQDRREAVGIADDGTMHFTVRLPKGTTFVRGGDA